MTDIPTVPEGFVTVAEVRSMLHDARHPGETYSLWMIEPDTSVHVMAMHAPSFGYLCDEVRTFGCTLGLKDDRIKAIEGDLLRLLRAGDLSAWLDDRRGRIDRIVADRWDDISGHLGSLFLPDGNHPGPRLLFKRADIEALAQAVEKPDTGPATTEEVDLWLADENREFEGKTPPNIDELRERGFAKFGARWRKDLATKRRNEFGAAGPLFPNLYSQKRGPRRKS
jgi:hypothetical protein